MVKEVVDRRVRLGGRDEFEDLQQAAFSGYPLVKLGIRMSVIPYFYYSVFVISILRLSIRLLLSLGYSLKSRIVESESLPTISMIVPAYNEEVTIKECIRSLLGLDYPSYEIVVVDDGSTDETLEEAREFEGLGVKVVHQENRGKANALNTGVLLSEGELIVTVDADTKLDRDSLKILASRFKADERLGAVAGNVKVQPGPGLLNLLQAAEYTTGINLVRKAESMLGCVMVVPGPIAALKRAAVERAGFFSDETFAEDFDITMKILKTGYKVEYEDKAIAYTSAPKNLEDLMKQRRRWYRGMIQVLDKNRDMYLNLKHGYAGMLGVPNLWFDTVSSIFNAALLLLALLTVFVIGNTYTPFLGLILYFGFEMIVGILAMCLDPRPGPREFLAVPLLPYYNVLLDGVRVMTFTEEMVGILMEWEKPRR